MYIDALNQHRIILASGSPRRRKLMEELGIICTVYGGLQIDESYPEDLSGAAIPLHIARKKSEAYPEELAEHDILITADTIVWQDRQVLHKPADIQDAHRILKALSGKSHFVYTGVWIRSNRRQEGFTAATEVWFDELSEMEIDYYIHTFQPFDKAGAYGIQEWIGLAGVDRIDGSFYNVMGLPVHRLYRELKYFINPNTK